jgi:hypothetical protein
MDLFAVLDARLREHDDVQIDSVIPQRTPNTAFDMDPRQLRDNATEPTDHAPIVDLNTWLGF